MQGFVSHYSNKLDAKGRVSIPAPFRAVLTRDGYEGLYCFPSPYSEAVDAGGNALWGEIQSRLAGLQAFTPEHDMLSSTLFGDSETLKVDGEGRVMLSEQILTHTGINNQCVFVGLGYKFQLWEPARYQAHRAEARRRAFALLAESKTAGAGAS